MIAVIQRRADMVSKGNHVGETFPLLCEEPVLGGRAEKERGVLMCLLENRYWSRGILGAAASTTKRLKSKQRKFKSLGSPSAGRQAACPQVLHICEIFMHEV